MFFCLDEYFRNSFLPVHLTKLSKNDLINPILFTIVFDEPEGIKEFEIEFQKLKSKLPALILNEMQPGI